MSNNCLSDEIKDQFPPCVPAPALPENQPVSDTRTSIGLLLELLNRLAKTTESQDDVNGLMSDLLTRKEQLTACDIAILRDIRTNMATSTHNSGLWYAYRVSIFLEGL